MSPVCICFGTVSHQDVPDLRALLEELHKQEQKRLQRRLQVRHEHASAQAQRQQALRRRTELHKILGEELEEAVRTGELEKTTASKLLLQYYSCQVTIAHGPTDALCVCGVCSLC